MSKDNITKTNFTDDQIVGVLKDYIKQMPVSEMEQKHGVGRGRLYFCARKIGVVRRRWHNWDKIKEDVLG